LFEDTLVSSLSTLMYEILFTLVGFLLLLVLFYLFLECTYGVFPYKYVRHHPSLRDVFLSYCTDVFFATAF
jgi:hypothetical protein